MSSLAKLGIVIGGYALACLLASGAVYINGLFVQDASQASAGMSAFGDSILFVSACGFLSLFPTGLGVYFLLRSRKE